MHDEGLRASIVSMETSIRSADVLAVADARSGFSRLMRDFRLDPDRPAVAVGPHRRPEVAIVPWSRFLEMSERRTSGRAVASLLDEITSRAGLVRRLAGLSHIDAVSVFGSVARGTETDDSDIDLLVDPGAEATYFDFAQFELDMEAVFQRQVDVVSRRALDPETDREILAQAVPV